jgi:P27 family predicted phage terminase small subunit
MPNPPVPYALKVLRGNPGQRRLAAPLEPEPLAECPPPPDYLGVYATQEWQRVGPELHRLGLLTELDIPMLAAFCAAFELWRTVVEILARERIPEGSTRAKPLVRIRKDASERMLAAAREFGMTPLARTRLTGGLGPAKPSKFKDLIA